MPPEATTNVQPLLGDRLNVVPQYARELVWRTYHRGVRVLRDRLDESNKIIEDVVCRRCPTLWRWGERKVCA